jgi:hypothetical protein
MSQFDLDIQVTETAAVAKESVGTGTTVSAPIG